MGYVAVKGGQTAIENAAELVEYFRWRRESEPTGIGQVRGQFRLLVDKVMGEGSLYSPEHAALALKQVEGDVFEAAFIMRAYRATLERRYYSEILNTREMYVQRRISSAFREIPGGQILGPSRDYTHRLLDPRLLSMTQGTIAAFLRGMRGQIDPQRLKGVTTVPKVIDLLRAEGLLKPAAPKGRVADVTREAIRFPAPRSAVLQMLARAETGALMALGYSAMRGFGSRHGTIGELRVGEVPVRITDARGRLRSIGRIKVSEAEMLGGGRTRKKGEVPYLSLGYGLCFGQNETKAICMGMLESGLKDSHSPNPANSQEFVLYHTECIEAYGFTNHLKLPHYVDFQSGLQNLRAAIKRRQEQQERHSALRPQAHEPTGRH